MKKTSSIILLVAGTALLITSVILWIDSSISNEPQSFGQILLGWITFIASLGTGIKGWKDLTKKDPSASLTQNQRNGGIIISGSVDAIGKDVIGRDQNITTNIFSEETAYNVEGLPNPYLGLKAFTYDERDLYAGREKLTDEALQLLISPGEQRNLLFVTGASGSGKSSFVQASLLPALVKHYQQSSQSVRFEIIRPARNPNTRLKEALKRLRSADVQILVIDQFEELFTQSLPNERDGLLSHLRKLRPFDKSRRHIIATLRSDYLGEMFDVQWIWAIAKQGIELREMRIQELRDAILRPLQAKFPNSGKRIEAELVEKLARDAAESVTYLPLLQVTLEELWNKGQLRLGSYDLLTDAIKDRADTVLLYQDFDSAHPIKVRTDSERADILNLLLSLVNASPSDDLRHDVRITRRLEEFSEKQISLLRELSRARLVSIETEDGIEYVNLIHETLIRSWDVLRDAISKKRLQLQKRSRFEEHLRLWIAHNQDDDFLLSKGQLAEALDLELSNDIALRTHSAQEYLRRSVEAEKERAGLEAKVRGMSVLARVSQVVNITLTFDDVLELIFKETSQVIPCTLFHMTLYNKAANYFYYGFRVDDNERMTNLENQPLPPSLGLGQEIIRRGCPILTQDYLRECQARNITPSTQGVYAWMGVPLNSGADTIGSLSVGSTDAAVTYTSVELELLQAIADQTVAAIVKSRLLQETEQRAHQLSTLNEITRQLTSTLEQEPLLRNILENAVNILNCEAGTLFMVDESTGELVFRMIAGPVAVSLLGQRLPPGTGIVGRAVQLRAPIIENDGQRFLKHDEVPGGQTGFVSRSLLVVPMQIKDRVLGVIEVINRKDGLPFVEDDQNLLTAFAGQAAVAVENARLLALTDQELAERVEELQVMGRIVRELNASLDVQRAMRTTLEWAMRRSNAEAGLIGMIEGDRLRLMAHEGYEDLLSQEAEAGMPIESPALRSAIESGQPSQISLVGSEAKGILPIAHTQIIVPIRREAQVIGLLLLESTSDSQGNLGFLNQLSDSAAIAIANAQLYDEVQRANQARVDLISSVTHELENPMTSIKGYTELLAAGTVGQVNEMQANFLTTVRSSVERISILVSNLNDILAIESNRLRFDLKPVDVADIVDEVMRSTSHQIDDKSQTVELQISATLPPVFADRLRVRQMLTNLISNANKYTPERGKILVGAEAAPNKWDPDGAKHVVHLWVSDNGIGIAVEDQAKIFQRFFRSADTKVRDVPGTGLGLNITRSLVELHGGCIWFESEYRKGTTFHFTIPVAEG